MKTMISKWGNSLALRIPASLANDFGVREGSVVDLKAKAGLFTVRAQNVKPNLKTLLAGITPGNLHGEVATGSPVGKEIW